MSDNMKQRRTLMHDLCTMWKEALGKDWVNIMRVDSFYFPTPPNNEMELREDLINRSPNELDAMLLSTLLNIEVM